MKKKFGELTIKEVQQICEYEDDCTLCPIYGVCPRRLGFPADWKEDLDIEVKL